MKKTTTKKKAAPPVATGDYSGLLGGVSELLEAARRASARTVNAFMTATYWEVGRRIVEFEQGGEKRAGYGTKLIERLSVDLTQRFGRGFGQRNVECMRQFFLAVPLLEMQRKLREFPIPQTLSAESPADEKRATLSLESGEATIAQTLSAKSGELIPSTPSNISESPSRIFQTPSGESSPPPFALADLARAFPLPWSHYVLLISRSRSSEAFAFYHTEALRGGWSVRQLQRQIDSQFYERIALSRNKAATPGGPEMIATSLSIEPDDFDYSPFSQRGGLGKAHQLFGEQLPKLLDELNQQLVA